VTTPPHLAVSNGSTVTTHRRRASPVARGVKPPFQSVKMSARGGRQTGRRHGTTPVSFSLSAQVGVLNADDAGIRHAVLGLDVGHRVTKRLGVAVLVF